MTIKMVSYHTISYLIRFAISKLNDLHVYDCDLQLIDFNY